MDIEDPFQQYCEKMQEYVLAQQMKNEIFRSEIIGLKNEIDILKKEIKDLKENLSHHQGKTDG